MAPHGIERRLTEPQADQSATRSDLRPADIQVAHLAAAQWGILSFDELVVCGLSAHAVGVRVRNGRLHPMHRGVYAVGHANPPVEGRFLAAVKACGGNALLSHYSAASLWGFVSWDDRHPEVTVAGATHRAHPGLRVHRATALCARDARRHEMVPVTSPARTLLDLASILDYRPLRRAVRQAQSVGVVNLGQLVDVLSRFGRRRGVRKLRGIIATGPAPTRSELEDVVLDLIIRGGLAHPEVNVPLMVAGRRVIPDFRWPEQRLIVEADGAAWHDNEIARADDAERQALLEAHGERIVRITWSQAITRRQETLARLAAAGAPSGA